MRYKLIIMMGIVMLFLAQASAFSTTTFNDSLNADFLNISGSLNQTRFIQIPENINLAFAFLNLTGFNQTLWGVAEKNIPVSSSTTSVGDIRGATIFNRHYYFLADNPDSVMKLKLDTTPVKNFTLPSEISAPFSITNNGSNFFISDLDDQIYIMNTSFSIVRNFSYEACDDMALSQDGLSIWCFDKTFDNIQRILISDGSNPQNITLEVSHLNPEGILQRDGVIWLSDDGGAVESVFGYLENGTFTGDDIIIDVSNDLDFSFSDENLFYTYDQTTDNVNSFFPFNVSSLNPFIDIGADGIKEFTFSGDFNQTNRTENLFSSVNLFLSSCVYSGGFCNVPVRFGMDSLGFLRYFNLLFSNVGFAEINQSFDNATFETDSSLFIINLSYDSQSYDFINADIVYNGTRIVGLKDGTGDNILFNVTFDIPLVSAVESEVRNFHWEIKLTNSTTQLFFNSTTQQQNVSRIHLEECNATFTVKTLNFTAFDEISLDRIDPFLYGATFDFWLGSGDVQRNNSFDEPSTTEVSLCISPPDRDFKTDAIIDYSFENVNDTFATRNYYFQEATINNQSQEIFLFLLNAEDSTTFILKVQDETLEPVTQALINIQRYYAQDGLFRTVQIAKTDDNGE